MPERLGILVNSNRHPAYVRHLAFAAGRCGKTVHVHFSSDGLQLLAHPMLTDLGRLATVTFSADRHPTGQTKPSADPGRAVMTLSQFLGTCDRCVVF